MMNTEHDADGAEGKKVLAIIGSPNLATSNTATLAGDFIESMRELDPSIRAEIVSLGKANVGHCRGCWACTEKGECPVPDGLPELKRKMLECDLLILGSPVYVEGPTSLAKAFIDRIYVWLHTLRLISKPSITAVTTAGSGASKVERYLDMVLALLGTVKLGGLRGIGYRPGEMPMRDAYRKRSATLARKAIAVLNGARRARPSMANRIAYLNMKMKARFGAKWLPYEHGYWKSKGWFSMNFGAAAKAESEARMRAAPRNAPAA